MDALQPLNKEGLIGFSLYPIWKNFHDSFEKVFSEELQKQIFTQDASVKLNLVIKDLDTFADEYKSIALSVRYDDVYVFGTESRASRVKIYISHNGPTYKIELIHKDGSHSLGTTLSNVDADDFFSTRCISGIADWLLHRKTSDDYKELLALYSL
jgi:hypothetical protein